MCATTFIYGLQRLFYGPLRQIEIEQLTDKAWYAVLDTLLAMPSLSHDVSGWMLAIFVLLLAGKVWGWIGEGRVDILEQQPPQNPRLFHARLSSSLVVSVIFDACMLQYCIKTVRDNPRPGMMVIFTFEFAILTIFSLFSFSRYILALVEMRILKQQTEQKIEERKAEIRAERERIQQEMPEAGNGNTIASGGLPSEEDVDENEIDVPGWEEKRRWLFGLELATGWYSVSPVSLLVSLIHFPDFIKLIIYSIFFAISLTFMGLPMHIMRDVYLTFSAFAKRIQDYSNYRRATQNMNDRYSDATAQELSNDNTCIVCRETMAPWEQPGDANVRGSRQMNEGLRAKKLPCGHILHLRCLKAWLERQQACPTCRRPVISNQPSNLAAIPGQPRIEGADAGAHPGGDNGQLDNAAHGAGQPARRAGNGLRMLNLGPLRIGVYNGPANQLDEAVNQRLNPRGQGRRSGENSIPATVLGTQSTQIQLMQVEERLVHQARTLAIEQTQLQHVRALEAELSRLRTLYDRNQQGRDQPPQPMAVGMPGLHMPVPTPFGGGGGGITLPQALQPLPGQVPLGAGHPSLPHGVTLPAGWTVTPLHQIGGAPQQQHPAAAFQGPFASGSSTRGSQHVSGAAGTAFASSSPVPAPVVPVDTQQAQAPTVAIAQDTAGGSPTLPAQARSPAEAVSPAVTLSNTGLRSISSEAMLPPPSTPSSIPEQAEPSDQNVAAATIAPPSDETASPQAAESRADGEMASTSTSNTPSGWSFGDINTSGDVASSVPDVDGSAPESETAEAAASSRDKGKGRAATVEEAQDAEG